jgi:hypothetical protein
VPIPGSISAEAQQMLRAAAAAGDPTQGLTVSVPELRAIYAAQLEQLARRLLQTHPVEVECKTMAGVHGLSTHSPVESALASMRRSHQRVLCQLENACLDSGIVPSTRLAVRIRSALRPNAVTSISASTATT